MKLTASIKTLMTVSDTWNEFATRLDRVYPKHDTTELGMEVNIGTKKALPRLPEPQREAARHKDEQMHFSVLLSDPEVAAIPRTD